MTVTMDGFFERLDAAGKASVVFHDGVRAPIRSLLVMI